MSAGGSHALAVLVERWGSAAVGLLNLVTQCLCRGRCGRVPPLSHPPSAYGHQARRRARAFEVMAKRQASGPPWPPSGLIPPPHRFRPRPVAAPCVTLAPGPLGRLRQHGRQVGGANKKTGRRDARKHDRADGVVASAATG